MVMNTVKKVFDPRESGHHYPSMHQDLHKGRLTEIDYLNGAIALNRRSEQYCRTG